jgi:hypothetical protein
LEMIITLIISGVAHLFASIWTWHFTFWSKSFWVASLTDLLWGWDGVFIDMVPSASRKEQAFDGIECSIRFSFSFYFSSSL